jgi:hypothetical protein
MPELLDVFTCETVMMGQTMARYLTVSTLLRKPRWSHIQECRSFIKGKLLFWWW